VRQGACRIRGQIIRRLVSASPANTSTNKSSPQSHAHHYVPQWYQRRFLLPGQSKFYYLDLHPDTVVGEGFSYQRNDLLRWGPARCFYKDDLYTLRFGRAATDQMERMFFGSVDSMGLSAVPAVAGFEGISTLNGPDAFRNLPAYMGAQRFRTPRGLDEIKRISGWEDLTPIGEFYVSTPPFRIPAWLDRARRLSALGHNEPNDVLVALTGMFQAYTTMWMEGVWEIVRAGRSSTKFIVTDNPVTFYCKAMFAGDWNYPNDCNLSSIGTRTLFPLGLDRCLIITHLQLTRHPRATATEYRENARYYDPTMMHLGHIQFGRELEEDEVLRINFILKRRATRYIAAAEEEWLYPERYASTTAWDLLDDDWFLLPHLWKIQFSSGMAAGGNGWAWAADEYGRHPGNPRYQDPRMHEIDWVRHQLAEQEWAKKRLGKSRARIDDLWDHGVGDSLMDRYLRQEGLLAGPIEMEDDEVQQV